MAIEKARCHDCGVQFESIGDSRCEACRKKRERLLGLIGNAVERGASNVRDIAKNTGFSRSEVAKTIQSSHYLSHVANSDEICTQCRERFAQQGSLYCLACRLALHKSLGDAATATRDGEKKRPKKPEDRMKSLTTTDALREKRRRTGSHRFDPSPKLRKGYR